MKNGDKIRELMDNGTLAHFIFDCVNYGIVQEDARRQVSYRTIYEWLNRESDDVKTTD